MTRHHRAALVAVLFLLIPAVCQAATLQVPGSYTRISDAIAAAFPGDTVVVAAGTYAPSTNGEVYPLSLSKAIHLLGAGFALTTLDAETLSAVVEVTAAPGGHISGFTVTRGRALEGAGFRIAAGAPEVDHCLILANSAFRYGSGIFIPVSPRGATLQRQPR